MADMDQALLDRPCEIHEMAWCALCNGDDKKMQQSTGKPIFKKLLEETK